MWWAGKSKSEMRAYLTRRGFAVATGATRLVSVQTDDEFAAVEQLEQWLRDAKQRIRLSVYLDAHLCRPLQAFKPDLPPDEEVLAVQALVHRKLGWAERAEVVWLQEKGAPGRLAGAVKQSFLDRLLMLRTSVPGLKLVTVTSSWATCLAHQTVSGNSGPGLVLVEDGIVTVGTHGENGHVLACSLCAPGASVDMVLTRLSSAVSSAIHLPRLSLTLNASGVEGAIKHPLAAFIVPAFAEVPA